MKKSEQIFNRLSLRQKINQMFILGFEETSIKENSNIVNLLKNSLGGVILFAKNIESYEQCAELNRQILSYSDITPFISVDQEGGLVDRFINIDDKQQIEFLSPMLLGLTKNEELIKNHTKVKAQLLKMLGFNMNYDPLLDVNSCVKNPIISIRSLSDETENVYKYSPFIYKTQSQEYIIPVVKHFPGHGDATVDSHLNMPIIDLNFEDLEKIHIKPFIEAIKDGIDAIMVAHVNYKAFDPDTNTPASLSTKVINDYLRQKLSFDGLIISDDMTMGGVTKDFTRFEAVKKAITAGVNTFIYQHSDEETLLLLDNLEKAVINGEISEKLINNSALKVLELKEKFGLLDKIMIINDIETSKISKLKENTQEIAKNAVHFIKKGKFDKKLKTAIIMPNKKDIFNYSKDKSIEEYKLNLDNYEFITYPLKATNADVEKIVTNLGAYEQLIFISYNSEVFTEQINLFNSLKQLPITTIIGGNISDENLYLTNSKSVIAACSLNDLTLDSVFKLLEI
ncbi:MAG: glycoside hydrolase family 3 N-terminal domain-containing protein [bacterium]